MRPERNVVTWVVDDRGERPLVAGVDRRARGLAEPQLLADALVDQHVRVDRHTDREHDAGDAGQRERRAERRERRRA